MEGGDGLRNISTKLQKRVHSTDSVLQNRHEALQAQRGDVRIIFKEELVVFY